jgi:AraC family transcriptional regulator of adaptative response/methylated-DNA-[protein]-cysteine methyltransferase
MPLTGEDSVELAQEQLWQDVRQRRQHPDRPFVYAVRSTGIYCRAGCPSRLARRDNVVFYPSWEAAETAGFRPCKRCDPRGQKPEAAVIAEICRRIAQAETPPSLAALAQQAGYSPFHFHRLFKRQTGLTPRQFAAGERARRVRDALAAGAPVTTALYDAGYNAPSRFYEQAGIVLGMAPQAARRGGQGERIAYACAQTRLGTLLAATTRLGLCAIELGDAPGPLVAALQRRFPAARIAHQPELSGLLPRVIALVETGGPPDDLPLDLRGTAFQLRVWRALQAISPGEWLSYAELASRIGMPGAARAVAGACAANRVAVAVPCHRVVRGDGALAGYRWGVDRKRALLEREA